jgi:hypothetical protein
MAILSDGTIISWGDNSYGELGNGEWYYRSLPISIIFEPPAPTGVVASSGTYTDKVKVNWNASTNASGYTLWRNSTDTTNSAALLASGIASTNYDDTNAVPGVLYYYWVKATNACGTSAFSSSDSGWRLDVSSGVCADYDGDRKADPAFYDEATGTWKVKLSSANYYQITTTLNGLGGRGLASVSADYDGDRKADPAVYNEVSGVWLIMLSSLNYEVVIAMVQTLGGSGYTAIPADYDGDRYADPCVYKRETGDWRVMLSSANYYAIEVLGLLGGTGYWAVAADYDGDHKADPAIYGESTGYWIFKLSSIGYVEIALTQTLGGTGYIPVPADYDGDGLADPAVRSMTSNEWIVMFSSGGYTPAYLTLSF